MRKFIPILTVHLTLVCNLAIAQSSGLVSFVNPFIGTAKSDVTTKWGSEGGTYPGSVAPWGYIQITPETSIVEPFGYNYSDSSIYFFSCVNHFSGYPNGSSGKIAVMPVVQSENFRFKKYKRPFSHRNEIAQPGYYRVELSDNSTTVETTSTERSGMFRITFPAGIKPRVFVGDLGTISFQSNKLIYGSEQHTILNFSENILNKVAVEGGYILEFSTSRQQKIITIELSTSGVSFESAQNNLNTELKSLNFDQVKKQTSDLWNKELSVIEVGDTCLQNKTIFYTALYHSMLLPWIISDVDGNYRGKDNRVHRAKGKSQYAGFSPWDTFRTLHPLLSLLAPDRQADMVQSMLDVYLQTGHLSAGPMTGNHAVPVIVDSYFKGILEIDSTVLYQAMAQSLINPPFLQNDLEIYHEKGYVPSTYPESVTRTVEYAYDDWTLAQFLNRFREKESERKQLLNRGQNYRNLFDVSERFLLPRNNSDYAVDPGTVGYKEGDKWVYSFFVLQNPKELVNLMGGDLEFSALLDSALRNNYIVFDNETTFHIPYLFNYANAPQLTQKWVRSIVQNRFRNTPGGIPGNDDLGSMSSWYVWNAIGIYPVCPGRPVYDIGSPIFRKITIHLKNNKQFVISAPNSAPPNIYISSLKVNEKKWELPCISHSLIAKGGKIEVRQTSSTDSIWMYSQTTEIPGETMQSPDFEIKNIRPSKTSVFPNELFWIRFSLANKGALGTKIIKLVADGKECSKRNFLAKHGETLMDSIPCRLFSVGMTNVVIDNQPSVQVEVLQPAEDSKRWKFEEIKAPQLIKRGESLPYSFSVQNIGGNTDSTMLKVFLNEIQEKEEKVVLKPGEKKFISSDLPVKNDGIQLIRINSLSKQVKSFSTNMDACLLDLSTTIKENDSVLVDHSGMDNDGKIVGLKQTEENFGNKFLRLGKDCYIEVGNTTNDGSLDESLTMMLWIYPSGENKGLSDIFTKGDFNVIQSFGNKNLSFFAGGWGRGTCTIDLPANWSNTWHHVAGVCDGKSLKLYLDGSLKASLELTDRVNLSSSGHWIIGRNEEFPMERIFSGFVDRIKVFAAALNDREIKDIVQLESDLHKK